MGTSERKTRLFRQREQEILRVAREIVERGDWREITIDEIARRAEIAKGTVYHHFRSKDELLARLATQQYKRLLGNLATRAGPTGAWPWLRALIDEALRLRRPGSAWPGLLHYCQQPAVLAALDETIRAEHRHVIEALTAYVAELIREGQARGLLAPGPGDRMTRAALAAILGIDVAPGDPSGETAFAEYLTTFVIRGWGAASSGETVSPVETMPFPVVTPEK